MSFSLGPEKSLGLTEYGYVNLPTDDEAVYPPQGKMVRIV